MQVFRIKVCSAAADLFPWRLKLADFLHKVCKFMCNFMHIEFAKRMFDLAAAALRAARRYAPRWCGYALGLVFFFH